MQTQVTVTKTVNAVQQNSANALWENEPNVDFSDFVDPSVDEDECIAARKKHFEENYLSKKYAQCVKYDDIETAEYFVDDVAIAWVDASGMCMNGYIA